MADMRVACPDCHTVLCHRCYNGELLDDSIEEAALELFRWVPDGFESERLSEVFLEEGRNLGWIDKAEKPFERPFFGSQSWSYALFGKETARSFHAYIDNLARAAGLDPSVLRRRACEEIEEKLEERRQRAARAAQRAEARAKK